jgi:thymidylate synthase ThyX
MAERGVYLCVVRQDSALPVVVHSSIRKNDERGQQETMDLAWELFQSAKGRIPFAVAEIHLSPATQPISEHARTYLEALNEETRGG